MLLTSNFNAGSRLRAASTMSAELSSPVTLAPGKQAASTSVELPGPQPMSTAMRGSRPGTAASRSRTGRVRSFSNFTYCLADQVIAAPLRVRS